MLYLLWGILNIGLFLFFVAICFKATRLLREKFGLFAAIIFVFGLFSFMSNSHNDKGNEEPNSNQIRTWKFTTEDSINRNAAFLINTDLEKTLVFTLQLSILYGKDKQGQLNIPISANSNTVGFVSGTNWKPSAIRVNQTHDNTKFDYYVNGILEWKLLGATIYYQQKEFKGIAITK